MEASHIKGLKILLLISSLVCLLFLLLAAFEENFTAEWQKHQAAYAATLNTEAAADGEEPVEFPLEVRQVYLEELGRVDRCVSCHVGIDNPSFAEAGQPLTTHPGDLLKHHPSDKFGCTICHQGQGRATDRDAGHGHIAHWPEPMLSGNLVYTSCGRCHYENDLYGGHSDLYGQVEPVKQVRQGDLQSFLPGADNLARGKQLVVQNGCLGCHKYRGRGGSLGPDITYVGDKTVHDLDFKNVHGDHTVENWMFAHFKSPAMVVPDTTMPDMGLSDEEAHDLAAYMISLKQKSAPAAYTPLPRAVDETPAHGDTLYVLYCSSCHGADGVGAVARMLIDADHPDLEDIDSPRELMTPSLRNADTLAVVSDDYLRYITRHGRSGTGMPAWASVGGLSDEEIDRLVAAMRDWEAPGPPTDSISSRRGNPRYGRALYRSRCAGCHGVDGWGGHPGDEQWGDTIGEKWGGVGVSLRASSFLAVASDELLRDTIIDGRSNTAMPSWKELSADEVSDVLAFIRTWQTEPADRDAVLEQLAVETTPSQQSGRIGHILFRANCANCHGLDGSGALGPSLNTDEFLSLVADDYLFTAIVHGRPGTAMPAWSRLSTDDLVEMIRHLRTFNDNHRRQLDPYLARGDWDRGRILFRSHCSGCHGTAVEGGVGPQLVNPTFLDTVSDEMLREWISYGKLGTPMLSFLRGQQGMVDLTSSQIEDVVTFLRYKQGLSEAVIARPGIGLAPLGAETFVGACIGCHGTDGEGLVGPALSNPDFLHSASDGFLAATVILGREGTAMVAMGQGQAGIVELDEEEVSNLVAFIRNWEHEPPKTNIPRRYVTGSDPVDGQELYVGYCAGCHGLHGNEGWAPALNNPEFLTAATDGFLQATVARGRSGTAMRSYGKGGGGLAPLTGTQINNIVSYVRTWAPPGQRPIVEYQQPNITDP
jgi:mono/diheme cytochrome c family protein